MRILYGVVGEGMGHAIRSRVVLEHLAAQHDVHVVVSGRAHDYLRRHLALAGVAEAPGAARAGPAGGAPARGAPAAAGPEIHRIWGLSIVHAEGAVAPALTALENLRGALGGLPQNVRTYFEIAGGFDPSLVISDYESWSWLFGKAQGLPVISLDNIQAVARCAHPPEITAGHEALYHAARAFTASKLPGCAHYLITTFFFPKLRKARTSLVPPLLRPGVLAARGRRTRGDHLLVYQTAEGDERTLRALAGAGIECRVYGLRRDLDAEVVEGDLRFRPFSDAGFVDDLASCRGVVASGGFTTMSEAVYLGKPLLSVPISGQFEQIMNARWLAHLGYGRCAETLDAGALRDFLAGLSSMEDALGDYLQFGNEATFSAIDELLERGPEALAPPG